MPPHQERPGRSRKVRQPHEVLGTPRSAAGSLWRTTQEQLAAGAPVSARDRIGFLSQSILAWGSQFLLHTFESRVPFPGHAGATHGVYRMDDTTRIGLAADWGTGTESAYAVGQGIADAKAAITIHLGDVYYSGDHQEFSDYFLPADCWPRGSADPGTDASRALPSYALCGNHEMYSGGHAYVDLALATLRQPASYFCLENAHWRIVGLDTGYECTTGLRYVLGQDQTTLPRAVRRWLKTVVFADPTDTRPVILLSHHQWFTAFDAHGYPALGRALAPYLSRVALWFWGHEHRFAGYAMMAPGGGTPVRARCIGHGGMPVELGPPQTKVDLSLQPVFLDARQQSSVGNTPIGYCGFALLDFAGPALTVRYVDERGVRLLEETWTRTPDGLRGTATLHVPAIDGRADAYGFKLWRPIGDLVAR